MPGVRADTHLHSGNKRWPLVALGRPFHAQFGQALVEKLSGHAGFEGVVFKLHRGVKNANDRVADVFVHIAPLLHENIRHGAQVFVHERDELLRSKHLGESGEPLDIREKGRDLGIDAAEFRFLTALHHLLDEGWREVGAKHTRDAALLPPLVGEVDQSPVEGAGESGAHRSDERDDEIMRGKK